jgi:FMN hydrolase / 5-amino-6-(5-phospho-D-ribitylamino)uracil phosphatase
MRSSGLVGLIVLDVGGTLGESTAPMVSSRLIELSPLPEHDVQKIIDDVLLITPLGELPSAEALCRELHIDPALWPVDRVTAPFRIYPDAVSAVAQLAGIAPVVTLSNSPAWHAHHHETVAAACKPHITALYTSYGLGVPAKPDPAPFHAIATRHNVPTHSTVAVGDRWHIDVVAALAAGIGTVVWITDEPATAPEPDLLTSGRVQAVPSIADVAALLASRPYGPHSADPAVSAVANTLVL